MILDQTLALVQVLELVGLLHCVFMLTIVVMKAVDARQAAPTAAFFAVLGISFGLPAALELRFEQWGVAATWLVQAFIPPVSYLLILQIVTQRLPAPRHLFVLALPLLALPAAQAAVAASAVPLFDLPVVVAVDLAKSCRGDAPCPDFATFLRLFGVVPGAIVLLLLWLHRGLLWQVMGQREMRDSYWVVLALIVFNVLNLGVDLPRAAQLIGAEEWTLIHAIFGLAFVYLVTTLVFRIGPKPVGLMPGFTPNDPVELTAEQLALAERTRDLMTRKKLYQQPTFSRADLARELDVTEQAISRVVNNAFDMSFRQFLNEYRVEEAKRLLRRPDVQVTVIAFDVGFKSLNSFSRVFKEITGQSPTEFRAAATVAYAPGERPGEARVPGPPP